MKTREMDACDGHRHDGEIGDILSNISVDNVLQQFLAA
jgi:hypothetical protein